MIIKRILISFVIAAFFSAGIAGVGLISTATVNNALTDVIDSDLPASENIGEVGRHMMSLQSSLNALLNPNLTMEQRRQPHEAYAKAKEELSKAMAGFNKYILDQQSDVRLSAVSSGWRELGGASNDWLALSTEIVGKYKQWEETSILNPTALLKNLEKYRGDHYFLVRRISEMISRDEAMGSEVSSDSGLCAFGQWQKRFESGSDPLKANPKFREAMDKMKAPHAEFHATAAEIFGLLKEKSYYNKSRIQELYLKLLTSADQVIGTFDLMIQEADRAQAIYQEAADLVSGRLLPISGKLQEDLNSLLADKRLYDVESNGATIAEGRQYLLAMKISVFVSLILLGIMGFLVLRSVRAAMSAVTDSLSEAAGEVDRNSGQLSAASNTLAEGATENAASLEETSAALEELSSMTRRNADNAGEADSLMGQATTAMGRAGSSMETLVHAMTEISDSGNEISKIIKTIDEIAFQTNLLALNAAVEAARAGEAGSGFAVVADEVRNLAIRSAEAARNTSGLIAGTIANINHGSEMVRSTVDTFHTVEAHSTKVGKLLAEVAAASNEQAQGIDQITIAMNQMDKVTQSNAASAEEAASSASQLSDQAGRLLQAVADLRSLVESGR